MRLGKGHLGELRGRRERQKDMREFDVDVGGRGWCGEVCQGGRLSW